ncbi:hypothetical protein EMIHUDRAFT_349862 [Emiliania huxleyi CCMP1516]|uniref:Uncharacterized protein n=2 Tax=Emiliania huxleyi TaxID=2903 RepID=A0A0D3J3Q9_EMIH1|nr:hypothetical protein EMIHUDRAFT_349862 [Emiliania huxleyi CCMP1516]EOD18144.1 hypothetical protein EMIHUDRAFT_349862 [Emiliania huxleyi CCMP1516]|mmetsp:Transcript_15111/g.48596  ORF Transcript_15111/g.48596 Transcript_15111/m.48596 type:complete len:264 (-) Transcript_15111:181-972(-)|eukprot:XP_005770573.1 hypothetical protein EMIHUDRAFT_349862 [Emiliania huxleyi CCMP1516]
MLGLGSYDDSDEDEEAAVAPAPLSIPAIAQQVAESSDEEDDDNAESSAAAAAAAGRESDEEGGGGMLPSMDEALGAAPLDNPFEAAESAAPAYGTIFDEEEEEEEEGGDDPKSAAAAAVAAAAAASGAGSSAGGAPEWSALHPERKAETTRQRNARKEKLGQATFSLKWDRDTGAEKASGGIDSSANLQSRTMPKQSHRQASRGNPDAQSIKVREPSKGVSKREQESLKDRTKLKRQKDQSASFLGGRWKTEQEMHMRDFFDS